MLRWSIPIFLVTASLSLADQPNRYAQQLASESDALVRDAIRRPYGWAWDVAAVPEPPARNGRPTTRAVTMETLGSPAAGLVLFWAGRQLHEPRYLHAAEEAARAIAASQTSNGMVRPHPVFGAAAGGHDEPALVPDRQATRAALGLLLAVIAEPPVATTQLTTAQKSALDARTAALRSSAVRAAAWLVKQQTPNGLWPSVYPTNADAKNATRIVRLDDADYRDSTLALLLAADVLAQESLRHDAARPVEGLLKIRLAQDVHGPNLWCTAISVDGFDVPQSFPAGPDVLASRFAMQTLLADYLFTGNRDAGIALDAAATTLRDVKRADGLYDRFLDPTTAADIARESGIDPTTQSVFSPRPTTRPSTLATLSDPLTSGSFAVAEQIDATTRLKPIGKERYLAMLSVGFTARAHVSSTITGLTDSPLVLDFPLTPAELPAYLSAHAEQWRLADGPIPTDLAGRVRRLWVLLLRTRAESPSAS